MVGPRTMDKSLICCDGQRAAIAGEGDRVRTSSDELPGPDGPSWSLVTPVDSAHHLSTAARAVLNRPFKWSQVHCREVTFVWTSLRAVV